MEADFQVVYLKVGYRSRGWLDRLRKIATTVKTNALILLRFVYNKTFYF